jgi:hypothetical protein
MVQHILTLGKQGETSISCSETMMRAPNGRTLVPAENGEQLKRV